MHLKLLIALILTTMLTAAHQEGDTKDSSTEMDQQWTNFKVKFGNAVQYHLLLAECYVYINPSDAQ